ncbi:probable protein phosphatase 2C 35 isoform X3 [Diospyros lotus]|uniref:probable protein phosphatase 2C 35 isoform X3 n=1 Tax=Diospyros lotus TaxID=55363 RepID=UPI00224E4CFF|nr:probable protein phosphatase 2C 35 isoform X3 [Diospyros lotus]
MGCIHAKCCGKYPKSSDDDNRDHQDLGPYTSHGTHILANRTLDFVLVPAHNFRLEYSVLSQRGYYPESPDKENQDSFCIKTQIQGNPNVHFFGVFDGHGQFGTQCSDFVKSRLVEILSDDHTLLDDPVKAYNSAFLATNEELHNSRDVDDSMSGTTAITVLAIGDALYVANVGDSRAVIAFKDGDQLRAEDLSHDQTPFRKDEYERVKLCGARVLSVDQVEGLKDPGIQTWGDEETEGSDPPRLWVQDGMYPGTAFTRSVGDSTAEKIGVIAEPEVSMFQLTPNHPFFVVASDGVFEFLPSQTVVEMSGTNDIKLISGTNIQPTALAMGKGSPDTFVITPGSGSYCSVRSDFSGWQHSQHVSTDRSPALVVPTPLLPEPSVLIEPTKGMENFFHQPVSLP